MATEYFANTKSIVNNNRKNICCQSFSENSYGNIIMGGANDNGTHFWRFKMGEIKVKISPVIGIVECGYHKHSKLFTSSGKGYGLSCNGNLYSAYSKDKRSYFLRSTTEKQLKKGDIIQMKLIISKSMQILDIKWLYFLV